MALVNTILTWFIQTRIPQIEEDSAYPFETQKRIFNNLIRTAEGTEWGLAHRYQQIRSEEEFKTSVPLGDYESLKGFIQRMMNGEENILWPGEIKWFAKSSGTTNDKSKLIPVSEETFNQCHFKAGRDMLSLFLKNKPESQIFTGKALVLGGSHQRNSGNQCIQFGDLSALLIENLPLWADLYRVPDKETALLEDWELKLEKMAQATIPLNITNISGVPTWTLLLMRKVLDITGKHNILEVWPNLEVYFHGAVNFLPYREQFKALIPSESMYYLETYNASEGFFAIQDQMNSEDLLLLLDYGIYYEFLPMEEWETENPKTIGLQEVKLGTTYALVISTNSGLWRYQIGDTIRFTSLKPHRIQITGRTKQFINAFGEELMVENVEKAMAFACLQTDSLVREYTVAPRFCPEENNGNHEWLIEFEQEPENLIDFMNLVDKKLMVLNSDYEAKRFKNLALKPPQLLKAPTGTFYNWLKNRGKLGGQHKIPRLCNSRRYLDDITNLLSIQVI